MRLNAITDMQKLVTEVRRFRSDQGLADRQKVPARLTDVAAADLGLADTGGHVAGMADARFGRVRPDRLG